MPSLTLTRRPRCSCFDSIVLLSLSLSLSLSPLPLSHTNTHTHTHIDMHTPAPVDGAPRVLVSQVMGSGSFRAVLLLIAGRFGMMRMTPVPRPARLL